MLLLNGDCIEEMQKMIDEGVQVDSVVTDPPYELGFMGKSWDSTGIAFQKETWELAYQLLKPGGHLLAFSSSRTYHRMAVAIEDSGFNIRDQIMWLYGSGFPKSLNIGKAIDKKLGAKRKVVGQKTAGALSGNSKFNDAKTGTISRNHSNPTQSYKSGKAGMYDVTEPTTPEAKQHEGWGTAIKPAHEPIVMARKGVNKPLNLDECRVGDFEQDTSKNRRNTQEEQIFKGGWKGDKGGEVVKGRWPANVIHDGLEEDWSKYFYCSKASKKEKDDTNHPTVKPIDLMRYLVKLVTPKDGLVLDPFAGTGTTGEACILEGRNYYLIEKTKEYISDIEKRINKYDRLGI